MILLKHFKRSYLPTLSSQHNLTLPPNTQQNTSTAMNVDEDDGLPPVLHTKGAVFMDDDIETEYEHKIILEMNEAIDARLKEMRIKTDLKRGVVLEEDRYLG